MKLEDCVNKNNIVQKLVDEVKDLKIELSTKRKRNKHYVLELQHKMVAEMCQVKISLDKNIANNLIKDKTISKLMYQQEQQILMQISNDDTVLASNMTNNNSNDRTPDDEIEDDNYDLSELVANHSLTPSEPPVTVMTTSSAPNKIEKKVLNILKPPKTPKKQSYRELLAVGNLKVTNKELKEHQIHDFLLNIKCNPLQVQPKYPWKAKRSRQITMEPVQVSNQHLLSENNMPRL